MKHTQALTLLPLLLILAGCPHQVSPRIEAIRNTQCSDPAIMSRDNPKRKTLGFTELDAKWNFSHRSETQCVYEWGSQSPVGKKYVSLDEFNGNAHIAEREEWYFGHGLALKTTYNPTSSQKGVLMEVDDQNGTFLTAHPTYRIPNGTATIKDISQARATVTAWVKSRGKSKG